MDKKLTDNEIKKALEDLKKCNNNEIDCGNCTLSKFYPRCPEEIGELALDLINRRELKIKGLRRLLYSFLDTRNGDLVRITDNELEIIKKPIKAEAYKEFAERLKTEYAKGMNWFKKKESYYVDVGDIDNLLKEMVGEDK